APTTTGPAATTPAPTPDFLRLCTLSHRGVFEWYRALYADAIEMSPNAQFDYDAATGAIRVRSNGECLDAYEANGAVHLHTWACDAANGNQQWQVDGDRVAHRVHNVCLTTTASTTIDVATCNSQDVRQRISSRNCGAPVRSFVKLRTPRGQYLSEWNSGLYANGEVHNLNELFELDGQQIKAVSNGECLDAFPQSNGRLGLHTYKCDGTNGNQQWLVADGKIEHATHRGQCLDVDPTDPHHNVQTWACVGNDNQRFEIVKQI
ncbi:hypothetical protein ACHHYP_01086, partial [Achlya hypogyna]